MKENKNQSKRCGSRSTTRATYGHEARMGEGGEGREKEGA